jgi:hypothetical protein
MGHHEGATFFQLEAFLNAVRGALTLSLFLSRQRAF